MNTYGKQGYNAVQAALAYANNYLDGYKARIHNGRVEMLRRGRWCDVGSVNDCAESWDRLSQ